MVNSQWSIVNRWLREVALITVLSVPFLFWGIGSVSLLDPDEGMYGSIALEMAQTGDWITPHFNGVRYLEKPPLYFWLSALTVYAFGPSEWAVRLWSAIPAFGTALLTWRIGNVIYGRVAGLVSALVVITGVGVVRYTRVAATDSLLVFSLTLAIYGFVRAYVSSPRALPLFYVGMALGFLSKGLLGVVFPIIVVGLFVAVSRLWAGREHSPSIAALFLSRHSIIGGALLIALAIPWHILAAAENPGFLQFYVLDNQLLRFLNRRAFLEDDIPVTTPAFLVLTWLWFFPWSLILLPALRQTFPGGLSMDRTHDRLRLLTGLWAVAVLGLFSVSFSKLEHYFLPAIPALSLMVGALWAESFTDERVSATRPNFIEGLLGLRWNLGIGALGCMSVGVALVMFGDRLTPQALLAGFAELNVYYRILAAQGWEFPFPVTPFVPLVKGLGMVLILGIPAAFIFYCFRLPRLSFGAFLAVAGAIAALVFKLDLLVEHHHSSRDTAKVLSAWAAPDDIIIHEGSLEYSAALPFYTGRQIRVLNGRRGDLEFGSRDPEARGLFLNDKELTRLWNNGQRIFLVTRFDRDRSAVGSLPEKGVYLLGRYGSRSLFSNAPAAKTS